NQVFDSLITGFDITMVESLNISLNNTSEDLAELLNRGGIMSMFGTLLIILCAFSFAGAYTVADSIDIIMQKLLEYVNSTGSLILATIASCLLVLFTTINGQISILLPV